ncbi:MAG: hypothetical protein Q8N63_05795 [Nanoarchaeota archaeon]|nr:hypothetical protein [Nanoarchaeota archaeon]
MKKSVLIGIIMGMVIVLIILAYFLILKKEEVESTKIIEDVESDTNTESEILCDETRIKEKADAILDAILNKNLEEYLKICADPISFACEEDFYEDKREELSGLEFSYEKIGNLSITNNIESRKVRYINESNGIRTIVDISIMQNDTSCRILGFGVVKINITK